MRFKEIVLKIEHAIGLVIHPIVSFLRHLTPLIDLIVRIFIARIFFLSGLTKIETWSTTLMLFQYEYHTPLLSPQIAAVLGTTCELLLPVLLVLGLGGRIMILIFFIYNITCMVSYPFLWTSAGAAGLNQHLNWSMLLALLVVHGPGNWSLDNWLHRRHIHRLAMQNQLAMKVKDETSAVSKS